MPYVESLIAAFTVSTQRSLPLSLPEARSLLALAQIPAERGCALAAVAAALVRERSMPPQSSVRGETFEPCRPRHAA